MKNQWVGKCGMWAVLGVAMFLSAGCMSSHPGSSSLAYVVVKKASPELVRDTTVQVFRNHAYGLEADDGAGHLVFERNATQSDRTRWARYGEQGMRMRVAVELEPMGKDLLVRADAYILRPPRGVEQVTIAGRRPYKKLLKEVNRSAKKAAKK